MSMNDSSHAPQLDTGPLSWVMSEIRDALGRSKSALLEAVARAGEARSTSLQHAKTHLHQAHGALLMVDVEGVGVMTQAAEDALARFKDGTLDCSADHAQALCGAYQAVTEYLEELLDGAAPQPARLFPYYRALREMLGADRIHPADLLFADLSLQVSLPPRSGAAGAPDYAACRTRFEKALLPFLKSGGVQEQRANAQALQEAIALVAEAQQENHARTFWFAMQCFAELVASGQLASDLYVKQLFGLINLQIRRLSQGQGSLPEAMLRDALFFIAAAPAPSAAAQRLRRAYRLDGLVPADYDKKRYGRIDADALKAAREALAQAKHAWNRVTPEIDLALEAEFDIALSALADAGERLDAPALLELLRQLGRAARQSAESGRGQRFGIEMAIAMLFVENGLDQIRQLPDDFPVRAEELGARVLALAAGEEAPDAPHWQGELARQIEQGQTVGALAAEMKSGLRQVEKVLDDYYSDPSKREALAQIDPLLYQLQGALAILDQDDAMRAVLHVKEAVRQLATADAGPQAAAALQDIAKNIGALGFFIDMLGQNFEAARHRFSFEPESGVFREVPFEKGAVLENPFDQEEEPEAPVMAAPQEPAPVVPAPPAMAEGDDAIEAELLEIFISEAQEVLGFVAATLPAARGAPSNQDTLTMLRRSFHTLKGSGRMVGLGQFADAGAALERVMNSWLSEARPASEALLALLERATGDMTAWVGELAANGVSPRSAAALVAAAAQVQEGGAFAMQAHDGAADMAAPDLEEVIEMTMPDETGEIAPASAGGNVIEFPAIAPRPAPPEEHTKRIGTIEIPLPLYNIYLAETDELMRVLTRDFGEWRHEPLRAVTAEALKAAHTLAGTSATVGFKSLREIAHALEMALMMLAEPAPQLDDSQRELLDATLECARLMLRRFALGELAPEQPLLVGQLHALRERLAAQAALAHAGADGAPSQETGPAFASTVEGLHDAPSGFARQEPHEAEPKAGEPLIDAVDNMFDPGFEDAFDAPALTQAAPQVQDPAEQDEAEAQAEAELVRELIGEPAEPVAHAVDEPQSEEAAALLEAPAFEPVFSDELDPDLLPVFLEEATDLLPQVGTGLRQWQQDPADTGPAQMLLRTLHTIKGSARMAGAMRLGQHTHEIETQIENMVHAGTSAPAAFDELMANYDHALVLFEQLQQPGAGQPLPAPAAAAGSDTPAPELPLAQGRVALVRVRADILDRLVNQAGEVSITRSKLENQVGSLKTSLAEFSDNLARLRRQLREVEMQAESQIASRMSISSEREFDPLEFDRFTRLQELTRMMAESVNDVAAFHESLTRSVDGATDDLNVQSQLTRELQRDLMRVRMVPFASLGERLFRVARQTAKEVDKRVNLDIRGGAVEIDRSVLEQMAAPFEHLLRNAIVHGIESRERRGASGKAETGELLVHASQQGNEVVIEFSDDGAGLDLGRIRAKAHASGLLGPDQDVSDTQAANLIFESGFSTAESLTELAGRGVGMDVVRSEAQALGGRVEILSEAGKGARFAIHLPLTLAVTQVVLTASAGKTYALPSILVEQLLQMKESALNEAHGAGALMYQGHKVALHYLPALLGEREAIPMSQRSCPVLILKNGADRLAVHVDSVLGNREVVIKNIGPQLSRMVGIAGATVLGSGEIVLILNPVALSRHLAHHPRQHQGSGAESAPASAELRARVVMVVDDSLTVRRVTQRLLEREGYQVVLAKDGVDALEHLQEITPDLMLVDIEMPRMDGFDLTRNIRGNDSTRKIPIVMITSRTADKHRNYALDLGVNAYFGKPFQEDVLLAAIAGLLDADSPPP